MTAKCIAVSLTEEQRTKLGAPHSLQSVYQLSIGADYTVLGITFVSHSRLFGCTPLFEVRDDMGRCFSVPACLFEVSDPRSSRYWRVKRLDECSLVLWPEEFHRAFFHDDLSEGVPEAVGAFHDVVQRLDAEFVGENAEVAGTVDSTPRKVGTDGT